MLTAGFTTLGMYPVTQVYQIEEDARRGDMIVKHAVAQSAA